MRAVFLFTSDGAAAHGTRPAWDVMKPTQNQYAQNFHEEGYCCLLESLIKQGSIDSALVVIESMHGPGSMTVSPNIELIVTPTIDYIEPMLQPGDFIFCRHGFRSWFEFLARCYESGKYWMLFYGANGGRERWRVWHVILNDLSLSYNETSWVDTWGRLNVDFQKPYNPKIFFSMESMKRDIDIMIGASHIHDKKGQWQVVEWLIQLKNRTGYVPSCVMPGRPYRGTHTNLIPERIKTGGINVKMPGMLSRLQLAEMMRRTKIFINAGSGQGDRSVIEAGACGCETFITQPQYHNWAVRELSGHDPFNEIAEVLSGKLFAAPKQFEIGFSPDNVAQKLRPVFTRFENFQPGDFDGELDH
jgi:hypothetical protein